MHYMLTLLPMPVFRELGRAAVALVVATRGLALCFAACAAATNTHDSCASMHGDGNVRHQLASGACVGARLGIELT